jgi:hypothetical protein
MFPRTTPELDVPVCAARVLSRCLPKIGPTGTVEATRRFFASVGRFVRALFTFSDETVYTAPESDELKLERELRRGMRGD